ncbi:hypothetical protein Tsubulata_002752 [Turnera subulata]|uniref:Uncharacterized protein n=1 Tax=Turnera subulata TaxID=218843 RepID=A0A9Q0GEL6_9ROSI|nr:hypothetical protein Tsubulata_002752 [Turnera subulata]
MQSMKTKKAGIFGKYGTRSGASLRKYFKKINGKHFCESCGKYAVERTAEGILSCIVCDKVKGGFASNLANQEESGVFRQPKDHAPTCGSTSHAPAYSALAAKTAAEFAEAKRLEDVAASPLSSYQTTSIKLFEDLKFYATNFTNAKAAVLYQFAKAEEAASAANDASAKTAAAAAASKASFPSAAAAKEATQEYLKAAKAAKELATKAVDAYAEVNRQESLAASALASYRATFDKIRHVLLPKSAELQTAKANFQAAKVLADAKAAEANRVAAAEASQVADASTAVSAASPALE